MAIGEGLIVSKVDNLPRCLSLRGRPSENSWSTARSQEYCCGGDDIRSASCNGAD